ARASGAHAASASAAAMRCREFLLRDIMRTSIGGTSGNGERVGRTEGEPVGGPPAQGELVLSGCGAMIEGPPPIDQGHISLERANCRADSPAISPIVKENRREKKVIWADDRSRSSPRLGPPRRLRHRDDGPLGDGRSGRRDRGP